jgi:hypothetical protein
MFTLTVCRRLDNRVKQQSDDSPLAIELHNLRARALHEALDQDEAWKVLSWGDTDDAKTHEWVHLWLELQNLAAQAAPLAVPALVFLGKTMVGAGISYATVESIKHLIARLRKKQKEDKLRDIELTFPDTHTKITCHPDTDTLTIILCKQVSVQYDATSVEVEGLKTTSQYE